MNKKEANETLVELLKVKSQISESNAKKKELEAKLTEFADNNHGEFLDGAMALEDGQIKVKLNPAKLIWGASQKAVSTKDRELFCEQLDNKYVKKSPDTTKMVALINGDKNLKSFLHAKDIEVVQETSYDFKGY